MRRSVILLSGVIAFLTASVISLRADTILLKSGESIEGQVVAQDAGSVTIIGPQGQQTFTKFAVRRISYGTPEDPKKRAAELQKQAELQKKAEEDRQAQYKAYMEKYAEWQKAQADAVQKQAADQTTQKAETDKQAEQANLKALESAKAQEERARKEAAERAEAERLVFTKGELKLTSGQKFDCTVEEKNGGTLLVSTAMGKLSFSITDIQSLTIQTVSGPKLITPDQIRGVTEAAPVDEIPLVSGSPVKGKIVATSGGMVLVQSNSGLLSFRLDEVSSQKAAVPDEVREWPTRGFQGQIVLTGGQILHGTILVISKYYALLETEQGNIRIPPDQILFVKRDPVLKPK